MIVFIMSIFGGIISDIWLGNFNTILILSIIYFIGSTLVSISSIPILNLSPKISLLIGLLLISIGCGGIKPSFATFGADQFKMPEQAAQMISYFSIVYFLISLALLIITTITPILRADVHCFGQNDCFPLAFGVPAILMFASIGKFITICSIYPNSRFSTPFQLFSYWANHHTRTWHYRRKICWFWSQSA